MGCFDTLVGTARCPACDHRWLERVQTNLLDEAMCGYREWEEVRPGVTMDFETHQAKCPSCGREFTITPSLVMGFLCPFEERPPKVYDAAALIEWLLRAVQENCRARRAEERTRIGLTCMMEVHVRELDGEEHLQSQRNYPGQYGMPRVEEGMTSEQVIRMMLEAVKRGEVA